jgi:hypothetical protein
MVTSSKKSGRLRALAGKLLLILFGIFIGALIAEVALRIAGYSYPEFYQPDASRGYALRPGMKGWYRKEGKSFVTINGDGLRDREHAKVKPPATFRIALLGDSYPEALPVSLEESFWAIMEKKLFECGAFGGKRVEVINFGVSGYGTAQELLTLRERVWDYSPDLVMLTITTNNDISDNSRVLKKTDQIPYFVYQDNKLALDDSFKQTSKFQWRQSVLNSIGRWIFDHSRLIQAIDQGHHGFKIWLASKRAKAVTSEVKIDRPAPAASEDELGVDNVVYREPRDAVWEDAWRVTEGLIAMMSDDVRNHGAKFLVITLSNGIQVYPGAEVRQNFMQRVGVGDLFYPDRRIGMLCQSEGIPVITLAPQMQAYADQNKMFLHGFAGNLGYGHWNQLGHRVAGELIAQDLCERPAK